MTTTLLIFAAVLTSAAPPVPEHVAGLAQSWSEGRLDDALAHFSDGAIATWVVDTGLPKKVRDASFTGREQLHGFLESFLPGISLTFGELKSQDRRVQGPVTLTYAWLQGLGIPQVTAEADVALGLDGRILALTLTLSKESSARLLAVLPEAHKAWVQRFYAEINKRNFAIIDELISSSFVQHSMWPTGPGRQGLKDLFENVRKAFPDANFSLDGVVSEGDTLAARMTARYTHRGEYFGIAPTGKAVSVMKMDFFRFLNGRCVEHWDTSDRLGLLQQLGVVPKLPHWSQTQGYDFR